MIILDEHELTNNVYYTKVIHLVWLHNCYQISFLSSLGEHKKYIYDLTKSSDEKDF